MSEIANGFIQRVAPVSGGGGSLLGFVDAQRQREFDREAQAQNYQMFLQELGLRDASRQDARDLGFEALASGERNTNRQYNSVDLQTNANLQVGLAGAAANQTLADASAIDAGTRRMVGEQDVRGRETDRMAQLRMQAQQDVSRIVNQRNSTQVTRMQQMGLDPSNPDHRIQARAAMPIEEREEFAQAIVQTPYFQEYMAGNSNLKPGTIQAVVDKDNPDQVFLIGVSTLTGKPTTLTQTPDAMSETNRPVVMPFNGFFALAAGLDQNMTIDQIGQAMGGDSLISLARSQPVVGPPERGAQPRGPSPSQLYAGQGMPDQMLNVVNPQLSTQEQNLGFKMREDNNRAANDRALVGAEYAGQIAFANNDDRLNRNDREGRIDEANATARGTSLSNSARMNDESLRAFDNEVIQARIAESFDQLTKNFDFTRAGLLFDRGFQSIRQSRDPAENKQTALDAVQSNLTNPQKRRELAEVLGIDPNTNLAAWTDDQLFEAQKIIMMSLQGDRVRGFRATGALRTDTRSNANVQRGGFMYRNNMQLPSRAEPQR